MNGKQAGFTLIELVMVIIIIGILAAVALPRFVNLQADARLAKAQALFGSIRAAAAITHGVALARGLTGGSVSMEGTNVTLVNAYPTANAAGIIAAAQIVAASDGVTLQGGGGGAGATINIRMTGATTLANCQVSYIAPTGAGLAPTITTNATLAGCS